MTHCERRCLLFLKLNLQLYMPETKPAPCALCGCHAELLQSHIVPKFAVEWLKDSSATGYLRAAHMPNFRKQDVDKVRLLCASCESLFSKWEKRFAENVFVPFQEKTATSFACKDWLLPFVISLAWRTSTQEFERYKTSHPHLVSYLWKALATWKDFLLGNSADPGSYEHHVFFCDFILNEPTGVTLSDMFESYLLRSVDTTLASGSTKVFAFTKLPGIIFWSCICPTKPAGQFENTIVLNGATIRTPQSIKDTDFAGFLQHRVQTTAELMKGISGRQIRKMEETARKNPDRVLRSQDFSIFLSGQLRKQKPK